MIPVLALALLQEVVTPESRAAGGMDAFSWAFMLLSMAAVSTLTVWCFARILRGKEHFDPGLWWSTFDDLGLDVAFYNARPRGIDEVLPWDHILVKKGREYLAKEQGRSVVQLQAMAGVS